MIRKQRTMQQTKEIQLKRKLSKSYTVFESDVKNVSTINNMDRQNHQVITTITYLIYG